MVYTQANENIFDSVAALLHVLDELGSSVEMGAAVTGPQ